MAIYVRYTLNFDTSTNANFQALWGLFDSCLLNVAGWTYVSQTGDANPNTVAAPGSGSFAGFRVYSTLSGPGAGVTWYHRFDWGRDGNGPRMKHQIGTTVDGSGNLGGQTSTLNDMNFQSTNTNANQSFQFAGGLGWVTLVLGETSSVTVINGRNFTWGFCAHGSVDTRGMTNGGFEIFYATNNSSFSQYVPSSGVIPKRRDLWPVAFHDSTTDPIGKHVTLGHPMLWAEGGAINPTLAVVVGGAGDFAQGIAYKSQIYGAGHTFLITSLEDAALNTNIVLGFRFDDDPPPTQDPAALVPETTIALAWANGWGAQHGAMIAPLI